MKKRRVLKFDLALSAVLVIGLCRATSSIAAESSDVLDAPPPFWRDLQFDDAMNPVFLDGGHSADGELLFAIEIPKGEKLKMLGQGTGVVVSQSGMILTNWHVVSPNDAALAVDGLCRVVSRGSAFAEPLRRDLY